MQQKKLLVIGGGAAGFFCAVNAARLNPSLQVQLIERSSKILSKVKISGGGRCNLTHASDDIQEMSRCYPRGERFVKKTFHQFFTQDTINWFQERGVECKTEADGRMFPVSDSSQSIIDCLVRESNLHHVEVLMNCEAREIAEGKAAGDKKFLIKTSTGKNIDADYVCVAGGGYPKAAMFDWLTSLGHQIAAPVPSLFSFNMPGNPVTKLMGVSVPAAKLKIAGTKLSENGPLLITHWGMSGPAILKLSAWGARTLQEMEYHFNAIVNWIPAYNEQSLKDQLQQHRAHSGAQLLVNKNPLGLPARFWEFILSESNIPSNLRWTDLSSAAFKLLVNKLSAFEVAVKGKTTFKEEFVTAGGILLSEIDPNTMMSRKMENLFFAGEVMDVDGITGGYNFQHAWTSGFIAAKSIAHLSS